MSAERYEFGEITVDCRKGEVCRAGAPLQLEPKVVAVLWAVACLSLARTRRHLGDAVDRWRTDPAY